MAHLIEELRVDQEDVENGSVGYGQILTSKYVHQHLRKNEKVMHAAELASVQQPSAIAVPQFHKESTEPGYMPDATF